MSVTQFSVEQVTLILLYSILRISIVKTIGSILLISIKTKKNTILLDVFTFTLSGTFSGYSGNFYMQKDLHYRNAGLLKIYFNYFATTLALLPLRSTQNWLARNTEE